MLTNFVLLKSKFFSTFDLSVVIVTLIYERVKYKDDGRELVGLVEFITIHVTFPVLNCWISYMLAY